MISAVCEICGSSDTKPPFVAREMMFGTREEFEYFECAACGVVQLMSIPSDLSRFYQAGYYAHRQPEAPERRRGLQQLQRQLRHRVTALELQHPVLAQVAMRTLCRRSVLPEWVLPIRSRLNLDSRVLDVGCGTGAVLFALHRCGFSDLTGVDPFIPGDCSPAGIRLLKRDLFSITDRFDFIMLHHAFEHMREPERVLAKLADILAPGGALLIRIPLAGSFAWRRYGKDWAQLDAPRHLFLHTPKSIQLLADAAELRVTATVFDSTDFQFWASEQYLQDITLEDPRSVLHDPPNGIFSSEQMEKFSLEANRLNQEHDGDSAAFYLDRATV